MGQEKLVFIKMLGEIVVVPRFISRVLLPAVLLREQSNLLRIWFQYVELSSLASTHLYRRSLKAPQ